MAAYSSILAWRILGTEKPGGLQFMGLQKVGHDWVTNTHTHTHTRTHSRMLFSLKKERNPAPCNHMDECGRCYAKWDVSVTEGQNCDSTYTRYLKESNIYFVYIFL